MNTVRGLYFVFCFLILDWEYAEAQKCPQQFDNFPGRVKYRRRGLRVTFKCKGGSELYGNKRLECIDGAWDGEAPVCIDSGCIPVDISDQPNLDMTESFGGALLKFSCEEGYTMLGATEAYCDGRTWSAPLPQCSAPSELTECDFEQDLCGWTQETTSDQQDWQRNSGTTMTGATGPRHDHTLGETGNGHYMYFETSSPTVVGDTANLISPTFTADMSPRCFDFWYHILGPDDPGHVGSLAVYIQRSEDFLDDLQPVFIVEGNKGDQWHRGMITIDKQYDSYQIVFVASRKLSYFSDIAIDDVRLYNCPKTTATTPTITSTTDQETTTTALTTPMKKTKTTKAKATQPPSTAKTSPKPTTVVTTTLTTLAPKVSNPVASTSISTTKSTAKPYFPPSTIKVLTTPTSQATVTTLEVTTTQATKGSMTTQTSTVATTMPLTTTQQPKTSTIQTTKQPAIESTTTKLMQTTTMPTLLSMKTTMTVIKTTTIAPTQKTTQPPTTILVVPTRPPTTTTVATTTAKQTPKVSTAVTTTRLPMTTKATTVRTTSPRTSKPTTSPTMSTKTVVVSSNQPSTETNTTPPTTTALPFTSTRQTTTTTTTKMTTTYPNEITTSVASTKASVSDNTYPSLKTTPHINAIDENPTTNQSVSVASTREKHPEDETLKPLMIGLGVGVVSGLIIIGTIVWVCVRRRKFYTRSSTEDELKPITHAGSSHSLNNLEFYQDEEFETNS